jgi:WD40 repeat protein
LAAGEDGYLRFYSTSDLSVIRSIRASAASLHVARFATDTLILCASGNIVDVWDLQKSVSEPILYLETKPQDSNLMESNSVFIWDVCVHPDQPFICAAVDSEGNFSIWDLRRNKLAHQLFTSSSAQDSKSEPIQYPYYTAKVHKGNILKANFIVSYPNYIVSCGEDGSLLLMDLAPLDLHPAFIENLNAEKIVRTKKLLQRYSSISDFCVEGNVIFTANDDESISVKTLHF